jgi:hypothetical protein
VRDGADLTTGAAATRLGVDVEATERLGDNERTEAEVAEAIGRDKINETTTVEKNVASAGVIMTRADAVLRRPTATEANFCVDSSSKMRF